MVAYYQLENYLKVIMDLIKRCNTKIKLRSFDKDFYRDIEGFCFYEKIKPQEKFDKLKFEKDHPDILINYHKDLLI